jgi:hypothetical protein
MQNLEALMAGHGARGAALVFESEPELPEIRVDLGAMQRLIQSFLYLALESVAPTGSVLMRAETRGGEVTLVIEDDGPEGEDPAGFRDQMRRGRPLLCSVAESILRKRGGGFRAERDGDRTRLTLILPAV